MQSPSDNEITARLQDDFDQTLPDFEGVSNASQLSPDQIFDLAGPETISEVFEATTPLDEGQQQSTTSGMGVAAFCLQVRLER